VNDARTGGRAARRARGEREREEGARARRCVRMHGVR